MKYQDIHQAKTDITKMEAFFKKMNVTEFIISENKNANELEDIFDEKIRPIFKKTNRNDGEKLSFFIYYSGHGAMDTTTKIMLNEKKPTDMYFALESKMFNMSKYANNYITLVFDCCREEIPKFDERGGDDKIERVKNQNFFVLFGCAPEKGVPAKSNIVDQFTKCLLDHLNKRGGVLNIVEALKYFKEGVPSSTKRDDTIQTMYCDTTLFSKANVKAVNQNKVLGEALSK